MKHLSWLLATALLFCLGCNRTSAGGDRLLAQPADGVESFGVVKPFRLIERSGAVVTEQSLLGKPWVASFVFTRCTGPCPRVAASVRALQSKLAGVDARLVTISVDPEYDTPEVLRAYASELGADEERWWFLTGSESEVQNVATKSFMTALVKSPAEAIGESITHTTFLAVVDAKGAIRGFYESENADGVDQAAERVRWLAAHR